MVCQMDLQLAAWKLPNDDAGTMMLLLWQRQVIAHPISNSKCNPLLMNRNIHIPSAILFSTELNWVINRHELKFSNILLFPKK